MSCLFRSLTLFVLLAPLLTLVSCRNDDFSDKDLQFVNAMEADQIVHGKKKLMGIAGTRSGAWVDSRSEADFAKEHIPGAISLPYERLSTDHTLLKDFEMVVVYGDDYNSARADAMSKRLLELGYEVRTLTGGLRAWKAAGNATEGVMVENQ